MWWKNWLITRLGCLIIVAGPRQAQFSHGPLESDSDSNCDLPPFVDLSESSEDDHEAISITGRSTTYILVFTTYRAANKSHLVK